MGNGEKLENQKNMELLMVFVSSYLIMEIVQNNSIQNPLASREKGYQDVYHPSPSFPGNFAVKEIIGDSGEIIREKEIWRLQRCGKPRCQICPLLNCETFIESNYSKKKYSILTNENIS